jgi:haloalkane dehalogenase
LNFSPRVLLPASFAVKQRLSRDVHRQYLAPFARRRERTAPWVLGCELAGSDAFYKSLWQRRSEWPELAAIIWGMRDPLVSLSLLTQLTAAFPHVPVTRIADAGHFPQEEDPAAVSSALERAL